MRPPRPLDPESKAPIASGNRTKTTPRGHTNRHNPLSIRASSPPPGSHRLQKEHINNGENRKKSRKSTVSGKKLVQVSQFQQPASPKIKYFAGGYMDGSDVATASGVKAGTPGQCPALSHRTRGFWRDRWGHYVPHLARKLH